MKVTSVPLFVICLVVFVSDSVLSQGFQRVSQGPGRAELVDISDKLHQFDSAALEVMATIEAKQLAHAYPDIFGEYRQLIVSDDPDDKLLAHAFFRLGAFTKKQTEQMQLLAEAESEMRELIREKDQLQAQMRRIKAVENSFLILKLVAAALGSFVLLWWIFSICLRFYFRVVPDVRFQRRLKAFLLHVDGEKGSETWKQLEVASGHLQASLRYVDAAIATAPRGKRSVRKIRSCLALFLTQLTDIGLRAEDPETAELGRIARARKALRSTKRENEKELKLEEQTLRGEIDARVEAKLARMREEDGSLSSRIEQAREELSTLEERAKQTKQESGKEAANLTAQRTELDSLQSELEVHASNLAARELGLSEREKEAAAKLSEAQNLFDSALSIRFTPDDVALRCSQDEEFASALREQLALSH